MSHKPDRSYPRNVHGAARMLLNHCIPGSLKSDGRPAFDDHVLRYECDAYGVTLEEALPYFLLLLAKEEPDELA